MTIRQALRDEIATLRQRQGAVSPGTVILILRLLVAALALVPDAVAAVRELVQVLTRALERTDGCDD